MQDEVFGLFNQIGMTVMKFLQDGRSGVECVDVLMEAGQLNAIQLAKLKELGKDRIMQILLKDPRAASFIQPIQAQFEKFLTEVLAWTPDEVEEEPPPRA